MLYSFVCTCICRTSIEKGQAANSSGHHSGRQETSNGLHERSASDPKARVLGQSVPERGPASRSSDQAEPQRNPDQNMVPEQASEAEESQRRQKQTGSRTDGARAV